MKQLRAFVAEATGPVLVLHDHDSAADAEALAGSAHSLHPLGDPLPAPRPWGAVVLLITDRTALRAAVTSLPRLGRTSAAACLLTRESRALHLAGRPDWPRVNHLHARRLPDGGALTVLRLAEPVAARAVFRELARLAVPSRTTTGRVDVIEADLAGGPLDEGVLNPIGFDPDPEGGVATLDLGGPTGLRLRQVAEVGALDPAVGASAAVVSALRRHAAVRVSWTDVTPELARTVAGLAMAGVPLAGDPPPAAATRWLGQELWDALAAGDDVDVTDPLRREEHSVRLRRAALLTHSTAAWRQRASRTSGVPTRRFPTCSVVLGTRRPHLLDFALRQVARQRMVDLELVVVGHGFDPDPARVRDQAGGVPVRVLSLPADTLFGDALAAGVRASSGDVIVKMDDDDWYGRDFLLDLMLTREYSGADIVGTTAEFVYVQQLDRTVRGSTVADSSERFARFVAGGSLTLDRDLLDALGGFRPVRRFCDLQLLQAAVAEGATVYRGHGLGYLLRRAESGHTWNPGVEFFVDPERVAREWPGFVPNALLDVDPLDRPDVAGAAGGTP